MDVHRLRVLRAVVADGSIIGAAGRLGYTPSAISQHLAALQKETGLALVQRSGRGIEPTAAGRTLADAAGAVFERLAHVECLAGDLRAGRVGTLSVSYFASAGTVWIPGVVAAITREFPGLRLDLRLIELLGPDAEASDVAIIVDGPAGTSGTLGPAGTGGASGAAGTNGADGAGGSGTAGPGFRTHPLVVEPYFAVVPRDSPLAARADVGLAELADEAWVDNDVARGPCRRVVLDACASVGFAPAFHVETQDYATAIRFVAEGVGITVIPQLGLVGLPSAVVAVPIVDPTPRRSISVRVSDAVAGNPAVVRILDLLSQRVAELAAA